MGNAFNREYASWPFRFWVLGREPPLGRGEFAAAGEVRVLFKAMPQSSQYRIEDLTEFLQVASTRVHH